AGFGSPCPWPVAEIGRPLVFGCGLVGSSHATILWWCACHTFPSPRPKALGASADHRGAPRTERVNARHPDTPKGGRQLPFLHYRPTKSPAVLNPHVDAGGGLLISKLPPAEVAVHPVQGAGSHELYLMCDNLNATIEQLAATGLRCGPVSDQRWGLLTSIGLPAAASSADTSRGTPWGPSCSSPPG